MFRPHSSLRSAIALAFFLLAAVHGFAKENPLQVVDWPDAGTPVLRFTFGKFKSLPSMGSLHGYVMDTTAQNLSDRVIASKRFSVYLFDKNHVRVGEDVVAVSNIGPGETVKFETTVSTSGQPVSLTLREIASAVRTISMTVNSTPEGATLSVDGKLAGITPRMIALSAGHHVLSFAKEGFNNGTFPLDVSANDVSGGSISFDLGSAAHDSIELRDGTVLTGDLVSISGMDIEVRAGGSIQHLDRNKVKRILLVEREHPTADATPPPTASN
jgi:hypothetical protein